MPTARRATLLGGGGLALARVAGSLLTLVMTPIAAGAMTDEEFGLWLLLSSVVAVVGVFGLGLGPSLVTAVATTSAEGQPLGPLVRAAVATAGVAAIVAVAVLGGALWTVDWGSWLAVEGIEDRELRLAFSFAILACGLSIPVGLVVPVLQGEGRLAAMAVTQVAASALSLALVAVGAWLGSWILMLCAQLIAGLAVWTVGWLAIAGRTGVARTGGATAFDRRIVRRLVGSGRHVLVLQISAVVAYSSDSFVAGRLFGAAVVPDYAVPARVAATGLALLSVVATPLWAATARDRAVSNGGVARSSRDLLRLLPAAVPLIFLVSVVVISPASLLLGLDHPPSWALRGWLAAWVAVGTAGAWVAHVLNGLELFAYQARHSSVMAASNIVLSIVLANRFGPAGLAAGTVLSFTACIAVPYVRRLSSLAAEPEPAPIGVAT